jgi:hypothetical protein
MARKMPVGMLVIGIINLVLGGLNFVGYLCCSLGCGGFYLMVRSAYQSMPQKDRQVLGDLWPIFRDNVPGLVPAIIAGVGIGIVLSLIQLVAGFGGIRIKGWSRWLNVIWGLLTILYLVASLVYLIAVLSPGLQKALPAFDNWMDQVEEMQRRQGQPVQPHQRLSQSANTTGNPVVDNILTILISLVEMGYAVFVIIYMVLPSTGRAVELYHRPEGEPEGPMRDGGDYYDDDYARQRRSLGDQGDFPDQPPPLPPQGGPPPLPPPGGSPPL